MIGHDAFCPESGAPLSDERHYDEFGRATRAVVGSDDEPEPTDGVLTAGARRSSRRALIRYVRRCHRRHETPDPDLYRAASAALSRLKRAADGRAAWDVHVWYALRVRLRRRGFDASWMDAHAGLRCPDCHGRLRFEERADRVAGYCGANCDGSGADRLPTVRSTVADLVGAAFDAPAPDPTDLLRLDS